MTAETLRVYHGTSAEFDGYPQMRVDGYGILGIFTTESEADAWYFADTHHKDDEAIARVYAGEVSLQDVEDLTDLDADHWDIVGRIADSTAAVVIAPDMSGVSDREIIIKNPIAIKWL